MHPKRKTIPRLLEQTTKHNPLPELHSPQHNILLPQFRKPKRNPIPHRSPATPRPNIHHPRRVYKTHLHTSHLSIKHPNHLLLLTTTQPLFILRSFPPRNRRHRRRHSRRPNTPPPHRIPALAPRGQKGESVRSAHGSVSGVRVPAAAAGARGVFAAGHGAGACGG